MVADSVRTLCPYCGVGCGLEAVPSPVSGDGSTPNWKIRGDRQHPSSQGMVCVKGATVLESIGKDRLLHPMFRESLDAPFQRISWEDALEKICDRIRYILATSGPDALCMYGSGQFLTEDYYTAQKLWKGCLGSNHFDANSRLCMSSAVSGYIQSLGSDGPPCCYEDLDVTDCAFLIGTNTAECHPIVFNRLRKRHKQDPNLKLIVVDPRCTPTAEVADLHLSIRPGTDIDLLNSIAHLLEKWGCIDTAFIDSHTDGFEDFQRTLRHYSPEIVAQRCGISRADLEQAAQYWAKSNRVLSMWSMGVNQSSEGTAKVSSIINLHLLTGQIGKPGAGPFSLTGQPNAMGGREAGGLSHLLPGYRLIRNPTHRAEVEALWGVPSGSIAPQPGRTVWDMVLGLEQQTVQLFWIAATNPLVSLPDLERVKAALKTSPFTIYQDAYYPTETSAYAHLLLPAGQWSEKTGTMTNSERRVTLCQSFQALPGEAREDWAIFAEVGRRLGFTAQFPFQSAAEVHAEFVTFTHQRPCDMTGISHERLMQDGPLQWPCPRDAGSELPSRTDSTRLYTQLQFHRANGRAQFVACHSRGLAEPPDAHYPYVLTTGRLYGHWHTQTRTGRIPKIQQMHPHPFLEIHPRDAKMLGIEEGQQVEVRSRRGMARFPATVTDRIAPGTVFVPMHWGSLWADEAEANALMHPQSCPDSKQPELKACAVQLLPIPHEMVGTTAQLSAAALPG
ncbi:MAG TPA: nitrate reductase [Stenomitos sp.]